MSHTTDLLAGLAELLAADGIGVWRESGVYTTSEVGITITTVPDTPDQIIALTPYSVDDTSGTEDIVQGVQIRFRAGPDPRVVIDREDTVYSLLHMRGHFDLRGITVNLAWRQSAAWIGADGRGRQELTANYYLRTVRTSPHLIA
ncbi:minor capsid protein [Streptomyces nanhaiensis]|uniref:minor capsid protein n=1 Tax=Streptomyces nanhaiensis TaxID=679319 RepID=UPI00399D0B49